MATVQYPSWVYFPGEPPRLVQSAYEFSRLQAAVIPPAVRAIGVVADAVVTDGTVVSVAPSVRKWATAPVVEFTRRRN